MGLEGVDMYWEHRQAHAVAHHDHVLLQEACADHQALHGA